MNQAVGDFLPIALGIAVSPIPISAVVLLMLGKRPLGNGIGFLIGWIIGVGLPASLAAAAVSQVVRVVPSRDGSPVVGTLTLLLGLLCWFFAWRIWRGRPRHGQQAAEPKWMHSLADARPVKAFALGVALSLLNPEDLALALSGGAVIGAAHLPTAELATALLIFTGVGSVSVLVPPLIYAIGRDRSAEALAQAKVWLVQNNAVLMALLLFLIGGAVIGHAIKAF